MANVSCICTDMGGFGSGNHRRKRGDTLERHRKIDAGRFKKEGLLKDGWRGSWQWTSSSGETNLIDVIGGQSCIELRFKFRRNGGEWQQVHQKVTILYRPCHLGGHQA